MNFRRAINISIKYGKVMELDLTIRFLYKKLLINKRMQMEEDIVRFKKKFKNPLFAIYQKWTKSSIIYL